MGRGSTNIAKIYKCSVCHFSRSRKDVVDRHELTHVAKIPCAKCGKPVAKTSMTRHLNSACKNISEVDYLESEEGADGDGCGDTFSSENVSASSETETKIVKFEHVVRIEKCADGQVLLHSENIVIDGISLSLVPTSWINSSDEHVLTPAPSPTEPHPPIESMISFVCVLRCIFNIGDLKICSFLIYRFGKCDSANINLN